MSIQNLNAGGLEQKMFMGHEVVGVGIDCVIPPDARGVKIVPVKKWGFNDPTKAILVWVNGGATPEDYKKYQITPIPPYARKISVEEHGDVTDGGYHEPNFSK